MTQYLLSVWHDDDTTYEPDFSTDDFQRQFAQVGAFNEELRDSGAWVFAGGLTSPMSASVVRAAAGEVSTTDGPYAESKEQMAGFWIVEAPDLDAARDLARRACEACEAPAVEVRPFDGL